MEGSNQTTREAVRQKRDHGISERDYKAWLSQRHAAKRRGIPFRFTLLGWTLWWRLELARKDPGAKRGRSADQYVMARYRDRGAYEPGNVRCISAKQNVAEIERATLSGAQRASWQRRKAAGITCHLQGKTGLAHPRSRRLLTPAGEYGSAAEAARAYGCSRQYAAMLARERRNGWLYVYPDKAAIERARG